MHVIIAAPSCKLYHTSNNPNQLRVLVLTPPGGKYVADLYISTTHNRGHETPPRGEVLINQPYPD